MCRITNDRADLLQPGIGEASGPGLSLCSVPGRILAALAQAGRGVIVLAVDGLSWRTARAAWHAADLGRLTSTFPSTSATAWMTSVTGADVTEHGIAGAAYRRPEDGALVDVIRGTVLARPHDTSYRPRKNHQAQQRTVFQRASASYGTAPVVVGRELDLLTSPWSAALTRGARRVPSVSALTTVPEHLVAAVAADVEAAIAGEPLLLWVYVNLDDHVHQHGYDTRAVEALSRLERHALTWAARGWDVLAYADHGLVPVGHDPVLAARWAELDTPALCELPAGGAGRVRWLYPRPGRTAEAAERLAAALEGHAHVYEAVHLSAALNDRIGAVVAVAASPRFPLPGKPLPFEHGATTPDEIHVPWSHWPPP